VLAAIAFCPTPPLLVPEVAAGAAGELDELRAAARAAVGRMLAAGPAEVVVLGAGGRTERFAPGTAGSLARYGVPVVTALPDGRPPGPDRPGGVPVVAVLPDGGPPGPDRPGGVPVVAVLPDGGPAEPDRPGGPLPLALTVGAWLLAGAPVPAGGLAVDPADDPAAVAARLPTGRYGLLVMGDGSARRSERAPGYVDPRAAGFDRAVAAALATGDAAALAALDPGLGAELLAAGVPAWRAAGRAAAGRAWTAELLHDTAPYGVGYLVASWT
jgi:hypothetical protein